ncbi:MAG: hypothetical protein A2289_24950 [Deltaproteobacteria bacterium RIFOXYA12_FULL_58_15]|nr:MAG: hypothetical protein A2289_24950 [Deltaproteobacteria bacterium RIFOXYA12_FULL_58_15]
MKHVLVLGAGLVSQPLIRYLLDKGHDVTVAALSIAGVENLIAQYDNGRAILLDLEDELKLGVLINKSDVVVSLLPFALHPLVAKACVERRKHMVTTSYVSPAMQALNADAHAAGVTLLNEIGVDPGLDHMSALRVINAVKKDGGKVVAFRSYCGGLPAPCNNDNPFGYKFSWSPRGVLLASRNDARYLVGGRLFEIPPHRLFRDMHLCYVEGAGDFEAYPNRDSLTYREIYGLEDIETLFRGTLRNIGFCDTMFSFRQLGLLELDEIDVRGKTHADMVRGLIDAGPQEDLRTATARRLNVSPQAAPIINLEWLGMLSEKPFEVETTTPLDALVEIMFAKLRYNPGEQDMVVLLHKIDARYPNGKRVHITSRMVDQGIKGGDSSMSRTVSLPAAIATEMILEGRFTQRGVLRPTMPTLYDPVLNELETMNIKCHEATETY